MEDIYQILVVILFTLGFSLKVISIMEKRQVKIWKRRQAALRLSAMGSVGFVALIAILQSILPISAQAIGIIIVLALLIPYMTIGMYYAAKTPQHDKKKEWKGITTERGT